MSIGGHRFVLLVTATLVALGCDNRTSGSNDDAGGDTDADRSVDGGDSGREPDAAQRLDASRLDAGQFLPDGRVDPDDGGRALDASSGDVGTEGPTAIWELEGLDPELAFDDIEPLAEMIGDSEVIALGESVHTTRGYSEAKDRLFRYLVEELGVRVYAFESPRTAAELVTEYVDTCAGDAFDAIEDGLFGVWANRSVLELVEWMCDWNRDHPSDRVEFHGFDTQQPWIDPGNLRLFVARLLGAAGNPWINGLALCDGALATSEENYWSVHRGTPITPSQNRTCLSTVDAVQEWVEVNRADLIALTGEREVEEAELSIIATRAWQQQAYWELANTGNPSPDSDRSFEARDLGMAETFLYQRRHRFRGRRAAIWAHNVHIAQRHDEMSSTLAAQTMGTFLDDELRDDYFALMLTGHDVSINWPGIGVGPTTPVSDPESLEARLRELELRFLIADLHADPSLLPFDPAERVPFSHGLGIGRPRDHFDAVLYIDEVAMMRALLW